MPADIRHLVVLMMENRSFDHMLGYLKGAGMDVDGVVGATNRTAPPNERAITGYHLTDTRVRARPHHDVKDVATQINGGQMDGFVRAHRNGSHVDQVMGYYTEAEVKSYDRLARKYVVCDRWFSSLAGPTWPNRFWAMCGTSRGITQNEHFIEAPTFFDLLPGGSFRYYSHDIAFLRTVQRYTAHRGAPIEKVSEFYRACLNGNLPSVSWIDPNFTLVDVDALLNWANDDHPPADIARGQNLVARVYNYLSASPAWPHTLFVVVYDEHGGFYDHVAPPAANPPESPPFDRLGVRIPALVVSPWAPVGVPFHGVLDHTCIARTALELFAPQNVNALSPRVSASSSLLPLLTNAAPRTDSIKLDGMSVLETAIAPVIKHATASAHFHSMELTDNQEGVDRLRSVVRASGVPDDEH